jgi:hypothetical protein
MADVERVDIKLVVREFYGYEVELAIPDAAVEGGYRYQGTGVRGDSVTDAVRQFAYALGYAAKIQALR